MKPLSPSLHGYLDYVTVVIFVASPTLFGLTGAAAAVAYALAGVHALMTLVTDFPLGAARLLPFAYHGWVERVVGPVLIALPFGLGFDAAARFFYVAMGVVIIVVGLLSRYERATR